MWNKLFPLTYERYLARQIYLSVTFILFALVSLFVFFDFIAEMNDTGNVYTMLMAFLTVIFRIPGRIVEVMPIAALIGSIYVCANMAAQSEYTILRVAGLQPISALKTLLKIAIPIAISTLIFSEAIGPLTERLSRNIKISAVNSGKGLKTKDAQKTLLDKKFQVCAISTSASLKTTAFLKVFAFTNLMRTTNLSLSETLRLSIRFKTVYGNLATLKRLTSQKPRRSQRLTPTSQQKY
jgi:lipopolysaccharide export LptBFGC system permease protein LptF